MTVYTGMERARISDCLNALLREVLVCAAAMILTIFFGKVKILQLLEKLP
jgi:hypothetical protein